MSNDLLIVGAGISGLTLALALHARGIGNIRVLEQSRPIRELGSGINILPLAVRELSALGILENLEDESVLLEILDYVTWDGHGIWTEPKGRSAGFHWPQLSISRARLQKILLHHVSERLGSAAINDAARVVNIVQREYSLVSAICADGRYFDGTMVVGADGIRSAVRAALFPGVEFLRMAPVTVYRGTAWIGGYINSKKMFIAGDDKCKFVVYPIFENKDGTEIELNWAAAVPSSSLNAAPLGNWNVDAHASDILQYFEHWNFGNTVPGEIINRTSGIFAYPMVDIDQLPRWSNKRNVVLIGDAAHGMFPIGSNGATQSIMDAISLAHNIYSNKSIEKAINCYELDRKPVVQKIQESNRQKGPEVVINIAAEMRKGNQALEDSFPHAERRAIAQRYAQLTHATPELVNGVSPYQLGA